jgi:hypothetical protein
MTPVAERLAGQCVAGRPEVKGYPFELLVMVTSGSDSITIALAFTETARL